MHNPILGLDVHQNPDGRFVACYTPQNDPEAVVATFSCYSLGKLLMAVFDHVEAEQKLNQQAA